MLYVQYPVRFIVFFIEGDFMDAVMSLDDNAMQETTYLLRNSNNSKLLLESISQLDSGLAQEREQLGFRMRYFLIKTKSPKS